MNVSFIQNEARRTRNSRFSREGVSIRALKKGVQVRVGELTNAEALVLPADKDGRDEITPNKQDQEDIMQLRMSPGIKNAQTDQPHGADNGKHNGQAHENLLTNGPVRHQTALVAQPALRGEGQVKGDGGDDGAGDEERLELDCANVGDVGQRHARVERGEAFAVDGDNPPEEHAEEHAEPYCR